MNSEEFLIASKFTQSSEIERARLFAFYELQTEQQEELTPDQLADGIQDLALARPNVSRLRQRLRASKAFVKGSKSDSFRLSRMEIQTLREQFPKVTRNSESLQIVTSDVIPAPVFAGTRGFIESLANQINKCYEQHIYDGCAVLMRRLLEVMLILSYQHLGIESAIQKDGNYLMLDRIVDDARTNGTLKLSRNVRSSLDAFRELGNFAAHRIYFTTRRGDIDNVQREFRAAIEELLYKSGIRK